MNILVVDDDAEVASALSVALAQAAIRTTRVQTAAAALTALSETAFDAVLLDPGLPDALELDALERLVALDPFRPIIVLTGRDDATTAVRAMRMGAADYLTKPVAREEVVLAIEQACERATMRRRPDDASRGRGIEPRALGKSPAWQSAVNVLRSAANVSRTSVLITGETGTGKEVAASMLHAWSDRAARPIVSVNCACFSPALLDTEIFGHEAGAFTGSRGMKRGLFELATGGSLFLDEVGELPLELQAKLLRVIEERVFRRVGGEREVRVDVRLISATNRPLEREVAAGRFRRDLYHRLRVIEVHLPPLRERQEDTEVLALHFVAQLARELGRVIRTIDPAAMRALRSYAWPGNVRELRNVIERSIVLCRGEEITTAELPPEVVRAALAPSTSNSTPLTMDPPALALDSVIRHHVLAVYAANGSNVTRTARVLGLSRVALRRRLREYGLKPPPAPNSEAH